ncbi:MAG: UDP-2,3-diacylglucosamine diphosphatase [Rikenellaceae bacterium]
MKYYFVSDVHLGLSTHRKREKVEELFESWLKMVESELLLHDKQQRALFLLGDIFDFWFEYKYAVPKGFVAILAQLKKMCSSGIDIYFLKGNHDCWTQGYMEELGLKVVEDSYMEVVLADKKFFLSHGDEIFSHKNRTLRTMYKLFNSKLAYRLFSAIVPVDIALGFGNGWSNKSRNSKYVTHVFQSEQEPFVKYIRENIEKHKDIDYFILGHLHSRIIYPINEKTTLSVLGHWIDGDIYYGIFDDLGYRLEKFN